MTVCIAALINWVYPDDQIGRALIAVADRMLTSGDIEYEPPQFKIAFLRKRIVLLVAGDITVHSEALTLTQRSLAGTPEDDVERVAELYASNIRAIRSRRAQAQFLAPLSLDIEAFLVRQKDMLPQLAYDITSQLQEYNLDIEALVIGCDEQFSAHIFHIDGGGCKTYQHDINFAAIGIGANHAKSQFMFARYPKIINYYRALPILYTAKRRAEVAPGVGKESDWLFITRNGAEFVYPGLIAELDKAYGELQASTFAKLVEVEGRLENVLKTYSAELSTSKAADQSSAKTIDPDVPPETVAHIEDDDHGSRNDGGDILN